MNRNLHFAPTPARETAEWSASSGLFNVGDQLSRSMGTRFGNGVVISLGIRTYAYDQLVRMEPRICEVLVDVRSYVNAPPRHRRVNEVYPHAAIIDAVKMQCGYECCVSACAHVLRSQGIVVIGCKGGRHRAPTVASEFEMAGRHVIHLTLSSSLRVEMDGCVYQVTIEDAAVLLRHCIHRWDNPVIVEGLRRYTSGSYV